MSLFPSSDGAEILVGTSSGKLYRFVWTGLDFSYRRWYIISWLECHSFPVQLIFSFLFFLFPTWFWRMLVTDLSFTELIVSHTGSVNALGFGSRNDCFGSVSSDGTLRLWDLSEYMPLARVTCPNAIGICFDFIDGMQMIGCLLVDLSNSQLSQSWFLALFPPFLHFYITLALCLRYFPSNTSYNDRSHCDYRLEWRTCSLLWFRRRRSLMGNRPCTQGFSFVHQSIQRCSYH